MSLPHHVAAGREGPPSEVECAPEPPKKVEASLYTFPLVPLPPSAVYLMITQQFACVVCVATSASVQVPPVPHELAAVTVSPALFVLVPEALAHAMT
jgi:hypothetical protein